METLITVPEMQPPQRSVALIFLQGRAGPSAVDPSSSESHPRSASGWRRGHPGLDQLPDTETQGPERSLVLAAHYGAS